MLACWLLPGVELENPALGNSFNCDITRLEVSSKNGRIMGE